VLASPKKEWAISVTAVFEMPLEQRVPVTSGRWQVPKKNGQFAALQHLKCPRSKESL